MTRRGGEVGSVVKCYVANMEVVMSNRAALAARCSGYHRTVKDQLGSGGEQCVPLM